MCSVYTTRVCGMTDITIGEYIQSTSKGILKEMRTGNLKIN